MARPAAAERPTKAERTASDSAGAKGDLGAKLVQTAPYLIEIASSDGRKVLVTNAFTLERRRLWEHPGIVALSFSPDGLWLYAVSQTGEIQAIDPDKGRTLALGKVPMQAGERVVDAVGIGPTDQFNVAVILARPVGSVPARGCAKWTAPRRVVLHRAFDSASVRLEAREGWPDDQRTPKTRSVAPNTRFKATIVGPALQVEGKFGAADSQVSKRPLPAGSFELDWMRDSQGIAVLYPKKPAAGCTSRLGIRWYRTEDRSWSEWDPPDSLEFSRGDQPWLSVDSASDGMRWLGVDVRGIELVEPVPRFRGQVALVAPPSLTWPKLRPGVRSLPSLVGGALRLAEMLMETGDLDAAEEEFAQQAAKVSAADQARFLARLRKLVEVRARRSVGLAVPLRDLRSRKTAPDEPVPAGPAVADDEAVEAPAPPTPTEPK